MEPLIVTPCPRCANSSDFDRYGDAVTCRTCDLTRYPNDICPICRGTGGGTYNDCPACDGNGVV